MKKLLLTALTLALTLPAFAASPADVAAAARVVAKTTKMLEKYALSGVELEAPEARADADGKYVAPYLVDGELTAWAEKALQASIGSAAGKEAGGKAAGMLAQKVPFGGLMGKKVKDKAGAQGAVVAAGGWEFIRSSSDQSFDKVDDIAVYMHVTHADSAGYSEALSAAFDIYPDLKKRYSGAIKKAQQAALKAQKNR
ncbi:MAG: hypothetical protein HKM98_09160 [Gammaproteobacteria bacterium]|nr:hypothetical protein [Gammaproteobacteria bacterium]